MSGTVAGMFKMPVFFVDREVNFPADQKLLYANRHPPYFSHGQSF